MIARSVIVHLKIINYKAVYNIIALFIHAMPHNINKEVIINKLAFFIVVDKIPV